jgi:choline-sulfatase
MTSVDLCGAGLAALARRAAACLGVALLVVGCGGEEGPAGTASPDVVLITIDTLRADHLGCYGDTAARTPVIDGLARQGTLFEQCQASVPVTLPSHASILTGQLPPQHGVRNNLTYELPDEVPTLAEALARHGYRTGAFVAARPLAAHFGLDRGFEVYDDRLPAAEIGDPHFPERSAMAVVQAAAPWIRAVPAEAPMFLWVHFFEPHFPYAPPPPFDAEFADRPYDGEVAAADAAVGALLEVLQGARSRSRLLVVTADHGEGLGEHGEPSHGLLLYQTTLHVPLIFHWPHHVPADAVVEEPVGLIDIAPTILSMVGGDPPNELDATGIALVPGQVAPPRRELYSETLYPLETYGWSPEFALRAGPRKVIRSARSRGYDLAADPGERTPLEPGATEAPWTTALLGQVDSLVSALARGHSAPATRRPSEEDVQALAALGYVSGLPAAVGAGGDSLLQATHDRPDPGDKLPEFVAFTEAEETIRRGQPGAALARLEPILQKNPDSAWAHWLVGLALYEDGREDEALTQYQAVLRLRPRWLKAQLNIARLHRRLEQTDEAVSAYEAAVALDPGDVTLVREAVGYLQSLRRFDAAQHLIEQALEEERLDATSQGALYGYWARIDLQRRRLTEGREHLAKARDLCPDDADLRLLEALFLQQEGRWQAIVDLLGPSLESSAPAPSGEPAQPAATDLAASGEAHLRLGLAQQMLGRVPDAIDSYRQAIALADTLDLAQNNLAWLLATERDQAQEALAHAIRAIELLPTEPEYQDTYLEVLERLGRNDEAKQHLARILPQFATNPALLARARRYGLGG